MTHKSQTPFIVRVGKKSRDAHYASESTKDMLKRGVLHDRPTTPRLVMCSIGGEIVSAMSHRTKVLLCAMSRVNRVLFLVLALFFFGPLRPFIGAVMNCRCKRGRVLLSTCDTRTKNFAHATSTFQRLCFYSNLYFISAK